MISLPAVGAFQTIGTYNFRVLRSWELLRAFHATAQWIGIVFIKEIALFALLTVEILVAFSATFFAKKPFAGLVA